MTVIFVAPGRRCWPPRLDIGTFSLGFSLVLPDDDGSHDGTRWYGCRHHLWTTYNGVTNCRMKPPLSAPFNYAGGPASGQPVDDAYMYVDRTV
jgi:hypothetical protein